MDIYVDDNSLRKAVEDEGLCKRRYGADMAKKLGISIDEAMERHAAAYALKRVTTDVDVANACLFLASDVSRQLTGVDLPIDGGWAAL